MADGSGPLLRDFDDALQTAVKVEEAPAGFRLRDLGFARSLGQLTVSRLFGARPTPALRQAAQTGLAAPHGRLIFSMDATASREDTWDHACHIQAEMFDAVSELGSLDVQLVYFRGLCGFTASPWYREPNALRDRMLGVGCLPGRTQLRRVLSHAVKETRHKRVAGVIYVGDAVEEDAEPLCRLAGELGMLGTPVFAFHEPDEEAKGPFSESTLRDIARLSGGAYCPFDRASAGQLRNLLRAVAVYAVGGRLALPDLRPSRDRAPSVDGRMVDLVAMLYQQMHWRRMA